MKPDRFEADVCEALGRNLASLRRKRGLTQEKVQELTGVSQQYLSELEAGRRNPTIRLVQRIATALGVDPADLVRLGPQLP